jgi:hypothetical protein
VCKVPAVEVDRFLRVVGIVLNPTTSRERRAACADFFAHAGMMERLAQELARKEPAP